MTKQPTNGKPAGIRFCRHTKLLPNLFSRLTPFTPTKVLPPERERQPKHHHHRPPPPSPSLPTASHYPQHSSQLQFHPIRPLHCSFSDPSHSPPPLKPSILSFKSNSLKRPPHPPSKFPFTQNRSEISPFRFFTFRPDRNYSSPGYILYPVRLLAP